jgi:predicted DNA-binding transcriptional regulator AlpA
MRFLTIKEACKLSSLGRSELYRREQTGRFPRRVSLGGTGPRSRKGYRDTDLAEWFSNPTGYRAPEGEQTT